MSKSYKPTTGEDFLENFFFESRIKYRTQVKINDLKGDDKNYRIADFYLPRLGFYVEYNGLYNKSKEQRERYDFKTKVLIKNRKPTIFLKPEDLGIIDHVFHSNVKRLFGYEIYYSRWKFFRYSMNRYFLHGRLEYFFVFLCLYIISLVTFEVMESNFRDWARYSMAIFIALVGYLGFAKPFVYRLYHYAKRDEIFKFLTRKNLKKFD